MECCGKMREKLNTERRCESRTHKCRGWMSDEKMNGNAEIESVNRRSAGRRKGKKGMKKKEKEK